MKRKIRISFFINLSVILTVICLTAIVIIYVHSSGYIDDENITRARSYFRSVIITGKWNSLYGGVYVEKKPGIKSARILKTPEIKSSHGRIYTLKNSSIMSIEISEIADKEGLFTYKLRSLKPVNPANTPDLFESVSLASFEHGQKENHEKIYQNDNVIYRYIAPLYVTEECMGCHGDQNYKTGDIRGGISITFDITAIEKNMAFAKYSILSLGFVSLLLVSGVFFTLIKVLKRKMEKSAKEIERLSVTDELTSLYNRKFFFKKLDEEFERSRRYGQNMAIIICDIDNFKEYNDRYGQQAGDSVLSSVAAVIKDSCRESDTPARYSGEEFAIILPGTGRDGAAAMAEKLRTKIPEGRINGYDFSVTISSGISILSPEDAYSPSTLIYDADAALCRAKEEGRNKYIIS